MGRIAGSLSNEKERLTRLQADAQELKNAQIRGEMVEIAEVERQWQNILRVVRSGLLALPSRVASILPHLTRADKTAIEREVRSILEELAAHEFGSADGTGGAEAPSEPDAFDVD